MLLAKECRIRVFVGLYYHIFYDSVNYIYNYTVVVWYSASKTETIAVQRV